MKQNKCFGLVRLVESLFTIVFWAIALKFSPDAYLPWLYGMIVVLTLLLLAETIYSAKHRTGNNSGFGA